MYFRTGYHYNKEAVHDKYVTVQYINTQYNVSDVTTKGLGSNKIRDFYPYLHGLKPISDLTQYVWAHITWRTNTGQCLSTDTQGVNGITGQPNAGLGDTQ